MCHLAVAQQGSKRPLDSNLRPLSCFGSKGLKLKAQRGESEGEALGMACYRAWEALGSTTR